MNGNGFPDSTFDGFKVELFDLLHFIVVLSKTMVKCSVCYSYMWFLNRIKTVGAVFICKVVSCLDSSRTTFQIAESLVPS